MTFKTKLPLIRGSDTIFDRLVEQWLNGTEINLNPPDLQRGSLRKHLVPKKVGSK